MTDYIGREAPYAVNRVKGASDAPANKAPNARDHCYKRVKSLEIVGV
jgi:hypothetical protein